MYWRELLHSNARSLKELTPTTKHDVVASVAWVPMVSFEVSLFSRSLIQLIDQLAVAPGSSGFEHSIANSCYLTGMGNVALAPRILTPSGRL